MFLFESSVKFKGELANDAKLTKLEDGGTVCKMSVTMPVTTRETEPEYHQPFLLQVSTFGGLANQCESLKKGIGIAVEGRFHASRYKGRKGDHRASLGVIGDRVGWFAGLTEPILYFEANKNEVKKSPAKEAKPVDTKVESFVGGKSPDAGPGSDVPSEKQA